MADAVARARLLFRKAQDLEAKGHLLRAAEYGSRAEEAVRDAGFCADNLVTIEMQRGQAAVLLAYVTMADESTVNPQAFAAHRVNCLTQLSTVVAALERRRVAGTLLDGKCTAAEEAWEAASLIDRQYSAAEAASEAKLVGYNAFLFCSVIILSLLKNAKWLCDGECSSTQLQALVEHTVHAADLMQQPRRQSKEANIHECSVVQRFFFLLDDDDGSSARGMDEHLVEQLESAWERLLQSDVLETRGVTDDLNAFIEGVVRTGVVEGAGVVEAALEAPGLRSCELASCGAREAHPQHYKRCAACKAVVYCSREHQLADWPSHKAACKAARKAAAASDSGASPAAS